MNPYEAPKAHTRDELVIDPDKPTRAALIWTIVGVGAGAVVVRLVCDVVGLTFFGQYFPVVIAFAVGVAAERAPQFYLEERWSLIAVLVTFVALAVSFGLAQIITPTARFSPFLHIAALVLTGIRTMRAERRAQERDSLDLRDREQRAHFAEMDRREAERPARKPAPSTAPLRLACAECGELTNESELTDRLCPACN